MRVVITNTVTLNGGDAAILAGVMHIVRGAFADARFVVFDSQADIAARYYPEIDYQTLLWDRFPNGRLKPLHLQRLLVAARLMRRGARRAAAAITRRDERRALTTYAEADLVISTGGTYLVEHYNLQHRLFELELCRAIGQPVVFFTQSLGPFEDRHNRRVLRRAFGASPLVLLRDERSRRHLMSLGTPAGKTHVVADAVFALADPEVLRASGERSITGDRLRVAISVRAWSHFRGVDARAGMKGYVAALVALVTHLVRERHAEVVFLSTCQGVREYWTHDSDTAALIRRAAEPEVADQIVVDDRFHHPTELGQLLAGFDVVVATRMHAAILALNAGTPVLPIAYEFKTAELFERLGLGSWVTPIEDLDGRRLVDRFDAFVEALPELRTALCAAVLAERNRALVAQKLLRELPS